MKKNFYLLLVSAASSLFTHLQAQSWVIGGNNVAANSSFGTNTNFSVIFETNNTERGRITNGGNWAFGSTGTTSKLTVSSVAGVSALRAQVGGTSKFVVNGNGGVSVGSSTAGPANGLFVAGIAGIGTALPESNLHVFRASAGAVTAHGNATAVLENNNHNYLNILAPDANETGILFGKPASSVSGGIIYNNAGTLNGLQFRIHNNSTKMVLTSAGHLGLGTIAPGPFIAKMTHDGFGLDIENGADAALPDWELVTFTNLALYFDGSFRGQFNSTTGAYSSVSDERLKSNIRPMAPMLDKVNQLKPSTYQFKNTKDEQDYNGFLAQDVLKVFPSMVTHMVNKERNLDAYTMDYSGFGVIAIKAIQELHPIIEAQKEKIATLEAKINKLEEVLATLTGKTSTVTSLGSLQQNYPNPVINSTTIKYNIPAEIKNAKITLTNLKGQVLKEIVVGTGNGQTIITRGTLPVGAYNYSLWTDGSKVETRQLIIAR